MRTRAVGGKGIGSTFSRWIDGTNYSAATFEVKGTAEVTGEVWEAFEVDFPYSQSLSDKIICSLK